VDPYKRDYPEGYNHGLIINCRERDFTLYSSDYNFRELFVYTLQELLKLRGSSH